MKTKMCNAAILAAMLIPAGANADHGRSFLFAHGPGLPGAQERYFTSDFSGWRYSSDWSFGFMPSFLMGLGDDGMMSLEVSASIGKGGSGPWTHDSTWGEVRRSIVKSEGGWNLTAGARVGRDRDGGDTPIGFSLIAGKSDEQGSIAINLMNSYWDGFDSRPYWTYAAAWSPNTTLMNMPYSIELVGDFEDDASHTAFVGTRREMSGGLFKFGIGVGLTDQAPDWAFKAGWVMRF